jgi:hypothetical protein
MKAKLEARLSRLETHTPAWRWGPLQVVYVGEEIEEPEHTWALAVIVHREWCQVAGHEGTCLDALMREEERWCEQD